MQIKGIDLHCKLIFALGTHYRFHFLFQVAKGQKEKAKLQAELGQNEDRVHAMSEHMKNVQQELNQTQVINNNKSKQSFLAPGYLEMFCSLNTILHQIYSSNSLISTEKQRKA